MTRALLIAVLLVSVCTNMPAHDADVPGKTDSAAQAPPLLDPQSIAVARLDLTQIDPDSLEQFLARHVGQLKLRGFVAGLADRNIRHLATRLRRLKELKVERVFVVLTLYGVRAQYDLLAKQPEEHIYAIVTVPDKTNATSIAKALVDDPPGSNTTRASKDFTGNLLTQRRYGPVESTWLALHFHSATPVADQGNAVLAGPPQILEYLAKTTREHRPAATAALDAAGNGPLQVVIAPSRVFSRVASETLAPVKFGELSLGQTLSDGFQWAALGIEEKGGSPTARVVIQSKDIDGAKQMQRLVSLASVAIAQEAKKRDSDVGQPDAQPEDLARLINFEVVGDQLHWRIDADHTPPAKLAEALRHVLSAQQLRLGVRKSINNIRAIGLALHNFYDVYKAFPTPATYDKDGKPLLSWRVHILPYVEEGQLYREFRRDEPWDSEHNKKLIERMPAVYRRPFADPKSTKTPYQFPIGEKTVFQFGKKSTFGDVRDGTVKTIGVVEVDPEHEVIWTKPDDWEVDWSDPAKGLAGGPGATFIACFLDVAVREIRETIDKDLLRALLTGSGGEPLPDPASFSE